MARDEFSEMLRRLDLNLLVLFDAVFRFRSLTRAADHLGITQSAASHALRRLRDFFGDPLFVRSGQGIVPTSRAEDIGVTVSAIIDLMRNSLLTKAGFDPSLSQRVISLFVYDYGEMILMPTLSARVRSVAPHCRMQVANVYGNELERGLEEGWVDLAISGSAAFSGEILQQRLFDADYAVVASREAKFNEPLTIEDYAVIDQIVIRPPQPATLPFDPMLQESGLTRRETIVTPYTLAVPTMLAANPDMIATVPAALADSPTASGLIRRLDTRFKLPSATILQFWHRRYHSDPFNIWLRRTVRDIFAGHDGDVLPAPMSPGFIHEE